MKLTVEQTLAFIQDDKTIADINHFNFVEDDADIVGDEEAEYTLVIKVENKFYQGKVRYYFTDGDYRYEPVFFNDFTGMEMKEVVLTEKTIKVWKEVN